MRPPALSLNRGGILGSSSYFSVHLRFSLLMGASVFAPVRRIHILNVWFIIFPLSLARIIAVLASVTVGIRALLEYASVALVLPSRFSSKA